MDDTFWEEDVVKCISPNFIFIWITGPNDVVENIFLPDSSAHQVSDL